MVENRILIGDVGATNARYALVSPLSGGYQEERVLLCKDYESCESSIAAYLELMEVSAVGGICLAVAGPVVNGEVNFPNNPWQVSRQRLSVFFGVSQVSLINDFEGLAFCLPHLRQDDLLQIGAVPSRSLKQENYQVGVIGPGTGLGAAGMIGRDDMQVPLVTEAGHVSFAPQTDLQVEVSRILHEQYDRVSNERVLSGHGLENIFGALRIINGLDRNGWTAAEIFSQVKSDPLAAQATAVMFEILGQVAGDFALSMGAFDGIFLGGGILQKNQSLLLRSDFRQAFENKGRQRYLMETIPTSLITHEQPGLLGATAYAMAKFSSGR